jgi:hypothetical protein
MKDRRVSECMDDNIKLNDFETEINLVIGLI